MPPLDPPAVASEEPPRSGVAAVVRLSRVLAARRCVPGAERRHRRRPGVAIWEPFVWEISSVLIVLVLVPLVFRFEPRFRSTRAAQPRRARARRRAARLLRGAHDRDDSAAPGRLCRDGRVVRPRFPLVRCFYELQKDVILYSVILVVLSRCASFACGGPASCAPSSSGGGRRSAATPAHGADRAALSVQLAERDLEPHARRRQRGRPHDDAARRLAARSVRIRRLGARAAHRELDWLRNYMAMMAERFRGQLAYASTSSPVSTPYRCRACCSSRSSRTR